MTAISLNVANYGLLLKMLIQKILEYLVATDSSILWPITSKVFVEMHWKVLSPTLTIFQSFINFVHIITHITQLSAHITHITQLSAR